MFLRLYLVLTWVSEQPFLNKKLDTLMDCDEIFLPKRNQKANKTFKIFLFFWLFVFIFFGTK